MTQQDDITQRPLTGDETRAAVREARSMTAPSDITEPGDYVMAGARALLSKLRAPVADAQTFEQWWHLESHRRKYPSDHPVYLAAREAWEAKRPASAPVAGAVQWPTMPASKGQSPVLFEDGYAEGWAKCMDECRRAVSQASAPVAEPVTPDLQAQIVALRRPNWPSTGDRSSFHEGYETARVDILRLLRRSAPVAGEAQPLGYVMKGREWPNQCYYPSSHKPTDIHNWTPVYDHAAPQASAESTHKPVMSVAEFCAEAGRLGLTADTLAAQLSQRPEFADCLPQADKDGGQQRAGDVSAEAHKAALLEVERVGIELAARLHEAAMSLETISQIAGRPGKDMETMDDVRGYAHSRARAARAALSTPQAEQGERDA